MSGWKDDNEYWTRKGTIHHIGGGKWHESVRKSTNIVLKPTPKHHAKADNRGGA